MKKINFKKIVSGRQVIFTLLILVAVFLFGRIAWAGAFGEWAGNIVGGIIGVFIQAISAILVLLVNVLMDVASYSDFIHAEAVTKGWIVVRDVCNMFFVLILLVIAFATILGKEEYSAKKTLPKLILAAILINFSKMFCGLMIDVANVMMLTFINAFKEIGSGNIIDMLGISDVVSLGKGTEEITFSQIVGAYIFGLIYIIIATVVVAAMLAMLVMRIVMIWIYVVLSPAAFFLQAVPGKGASFAQQWWTKWTSNLIVGPVIAFFLWLSFAALQTGSGSPIAIDAGSQAEIDAQTAGIQKVDADQNIVASKAGTPAAMAKFAIAIGLLLGGMKIAQEVGGETGAILGKGMAQLNKGKALVTGAVGGFALARAKDAGRATKRGALWAGGTAANIGSGRNADGTQKGRKVGNFMLQWNKDVASAHKKEKVASREKYLKKIGIGEKSAEIGKDIVNDVKTSNVARVAQNIGNISGPGAAIATTLAGPAGWALAGGTLLAGVGMGLYRNHKAKKNKKEVEDYKATQMAADDTTIANYQVATTHTPAETEAYQKASTKKREMKELEDKNKKNPLAVTKGALENMTSKQKAAKDWVSVVKSDDKFVENAGKGGFYSSTGITDGGKRKLDELNKGGDDSNKAIDNLVSGVAGLDNTNDTDEKKLEEIAKYIAAWEKGGETANAATLGRLKAALTAQGKNPDDFKDKVITNYKPLSSQMELKPGSGSLQYDAFAKNSAKAPVDRNSAKDVMGVSFAKLNAKAEAMGMGTEYKLDEKAGVNQKVDGVKMDALAIVMSGLIDDEIKALQGVGDELSQEKISKLNTAKSRLLTGKVSGMSLVNSDVEYKGENDSEKRANKYNTIQHETMHQAGAKNEELVDESSNALQEGKLIGRIPKTNQRYDEEIGKLIASMEQAQADPEAIRSAVAGQIDKWKPSNAQRVVETENGERDALKETTPSVEVKISGAEDIEKALGKFTATLNKTNTVSGPKGQNMNLSVNDRAFFDRIARKAAKKEQAIVDNLKPLSAMAADLKNKQKA